jgi:hypothetical protein
MVGNEKGVGRQCGYLPRLCCPSQCGGFSPEGTGFSECFYSTLAYQPRPLNGRAKNKAARKARAAAGLHDPQRGSEVPVARAENAASGAVLPDWLVHGLAAISDHWPKMVDGES